MQHRRLSVLAAAIIVFSFFSCKKKLPEVTTYPVTSITGNSAQGGGKVTDEGDAKVTRRGVCWSIYHEPNINNSQELAGEGEGSYTAFMGNLTNNTLYYVRAFATSEAGTAYGEELQFTTVNTSIPTLPTILYNGTLIYVYPTDNNASTICGPNGATGATSITNGTQNTATLNALNGNYAAKFCAQLNAYGYNDWYLPSKEELNALYINKNNIGYFNNSFGYWSSTESGPQSAWAQNFSGGGSQIELFKNDGSIGCRCIRK